MQTFKAENNIVGTSRGLMNEQQLTDVNTQLIQARAATAEAKASRPHRGDFRQGFAQPTVTDALNNSVITRLRAQYLDLERSMPIGRTVRQDPSGRGQSGQQDGGIAGKYCGRTHRIGDAYRSEYEIAKSRENSLDDHVKALVGQAGHTGQAQVKLRDLESAADTYRNLYNNFLDKLQRRRRKRAFRSAKPA